MLQSKAQRKNRFIVHTNDHTRITESITSYVQSITSYPFVAKSFTSIVQSRRLSAISHSLSTSTFMTDGIAFFLIILE